jgi:hypothetical protein
MMLLLTLVLAAAICVTLGVRGLQFLLSGLIMLVALGLLGVAYMQLPM